MALRFQFDRKNKILLLRVEGPLTQEVLAEVQVAITAYQMKGMSKPRILTSPMAGSKSVIAFLL